MEQQRSPITVNPHQAGAHPPGGARRGWPSLPPRRMQQHEVSLRGVIGDLYSRGLLAGLCLFQRHRAASRRVRRARPERPHPSAAHGEDRERAFGTRVQWRRGGALTYGGQKKARKKCFLQNERREVGRGVMTMTMEETPWNWN